MGRGRAPRFKPVIGYSIQGAGTRQDPAVLTFNLAYDTAREEFLRGQLPPGIRIGRDNSLGLGFELTGNSPDTSRSQLLDAFYALARRNDWPTKHYA